MLPGGVRTVDHLRGTGGHYANIGRPPRRRVTFSGAMNSSAERSAPLLPVIQTLPA